MIIEKKRFRQQGIKAWAHRDFALVKESQNLITEAENHNDHRVSAATGLAGDYLDRSDYGLCKLPL